MTIKDIRKKYNLTQTQLSELTGIPKRTIENWESGSRAAKDYIPDLIEAKIEMLIKNGGNDMANFNLGLEVCRVRERAVGAEGIYYRYIRKNNIDFYDRENIYVKNLYELQEIGTIGADKCNTKKDTTALINRIAELRKLVD